MAIDFAALPPEINSSLMYAGPGSGPMLSAAAAWDGLAAELAATATACESAVSNLTSEPWVGPASSSMTAATAPYLAWMHTAAARAAQTATRAKGAAAAYEAAFEATVPPGVVAANRTLLASLTATNILGQNTPAMAATQADYAEMWAQDAAAMYSYSASAATAAELTPFTAPEQLTNPVGQAGQAAATAHTTGAGVQTTLAESISAVPQVLQVLASPLPVAAAPEVVDGAVAQVATSSAISGLSLGSVYHGAIGSANFFQRAATQFASQFSSNDSPSTTDIMERVNRIALATGAVDPDELQAADGASHLRPGGFGSWQNWLKWLKGLSAQVFHASAVADGGTASGVGGLSVPQSWAAAAPEMHLVSAESPSGSIEAAPAAAASTAGSLGAQAALAGMAGRALAGTVAPGRDGVRATSRERSKPSGSAAKEIAAALREYASLRDSGLITPAEFNKHKERLMSLDPLSGR